MEIGMNVVFDIIGDFRSIRLSRLPFFEWN